MKLPTEVLNSFGVPKLQPAHKNVPHANCSLHDSFDTTYAPNTQDATVLTWKHNKQTNRLHVCGPREQIVAFKSSFCFARAITIQRVNLHPFALKPFAKITAFLQISLHDFYLIRIHRTSWAV